MVVPPEASTPFFPTSPGAEIDTQTGNDSHGALNEKTLIGESCAGCSIELEIDDLVPEAAELSKITVYVINLASEVNRRERMKGIAARSVYEWVFVDAVYGKDLPNLDEYRKHETRELRAGEIGCFLSHLKAHALIAENRPGHWGLILEDDVHLAPNWEYNLRVAIRQITFADVLFCGSDGPAKFFRVMGPEVEEHFANRNERDRSFSDDLVVAAPRLNMHAYALSPQGAKNIKKRIGNIEAAIDMQLHFDRLSLKKYALKHGIAEQDKSFGSSVQDPLVHHAIIVVDSCGCI